LICWHWDHSLGRNVKGVDFLSCLYHTQDTALPVAFQLIQKSEWSTDKKTGKQRRVCPKTKNDYFRDMVACCLTNQLPFRYALADSWFGSAEIMVFVKKTHQKDLIFPIKDNRKLALSHADKLAGRYVSSGTLQIEENATQEIWLEGVDFPSVMQAGLYKQGRQPGYSLSGEQRYDFRGPSDADDLSKTMESRSLSQVLKEQRQFCQVADQDDSHPEQPLLRLFVGVREVGEASPSDQDEPFLDES
jgi:hypothetical protein